MVPGPENPAFLPSGRPAGNRKAAPMWLPTQWIATHEQRTKKTLQLPTPNTGTAGRRGGADRRKPKAQRSALITYSSEPR